MMSKLQKVCGRQQQLLLVQQLVFVIPLSPLAVTLEYFEKICSAFEDVDEDILWVIAESQPAFQE